MALGEVAESSHGDGVLAPPDDESAVAYRDWSRRLDAAVAAGEITQHEADVAEWRYAWPFRDDVRAAFVGPDRITVYDAAHLPLIRKRSDDLTPAERRMTPAVGELRRDASGALVCVPTTRNGQRQAHRDLLEDVAAAGGIEATLPQTGRPAGSGFGLRIVAFIDSRPPEVTMREAVERAAEQLLWSPESVRRAYYRQKRSTASANRRDER